MFIDWISLRVKDAKAIASWYEQLTGLSVVSERPDIGSVAVKAAATLPRMIPAAWSGDKVHAGASQKPGVRPAKLFIERCG